MSQQYLQCSHSLIVNVLRAIVTRPISPSTTSTVTNSKRATVDLGKNLQQSTLRWPTATRLWMKTMATSRHDLLNTPSSRQLYSTSSTLTSSIPTDTTSLSGYDNNDYMIDSLDELSDQATTKSHQSSLKNSSATKSDGKQNSMVYRPKIDKWVAASRFKTSKKPNTVDDYNKRVVYAVMNDQQNKAIKYVHEMERRDLMPDNITYTSIINGYSRQADMVRAKKWLRRMRANGLRPDVYTYTSMIDGYMRLCDVDMAEDTFKTMMERKVQPNLVTYNVLMHHSVLKLDIETATKFWSKLCQVGLEPDVYSYAILIQGLGNEALVDEAWRIYDKMKQQKVNVNNVVATTLMGIHVKHKDNSYAIQLFQDFFNQHNQQQQTLVATGHTRNIILNAALGHVELNKIRKYYREFRSLSEDGERTYSPLWGDQTNANHNVYTYTTFMRAFLRHNDVGMVSQVYQDMVARSIKPTLVTFGTLMLAHAFVPDPDACENMLNELKSHDVKVNVTLYTILMRAWAKANQWEQVKRVYDNMKADRIQPNKMTLEVLRWAKEKTAI